LKINNIVYQVEKDVDDRVMGVQKVVVADAYFNELEESKKMDHDLEEQWKEVEDAFSVKLSGIALQNALRPSMM